MPDLMDALRAAVGLLLHADAELVGILLLTLRVSLSAVLLASVLGLSLGCLLALARFPGRGACIVALNALMGLPPVVVGLVVYLLLSRSGPLGELGLLFTPQAMVIAQTVLVTPIIAALSRQVLEDLWREYRDLFRSLQASPLLAGTTLLWEARYSLLTGVLAGFGRAIAEVGAVLIVGGNIAHVTRVMTTAIALETSKGDLALALGLGIILLTLALLVNGAANVLQDLLGGRRASA